MNSASVGMAIANCMGSSPLLARIARCDGAEYHRSWRRTIAREQHVGRIGDGRKTQSRHGFEHGAGPAAASRAGSAGLRARRFRAARDDGAPHRAQRGCGRSLAAHGRGGRCLSRHSRLSLRHRPDRLRPLDHRDGIRSRGRTRKAAAGLFHPRRPSGTGERCRDRTRRRETQGAQGADSGTAGRRLLQIAGRPALACRRGAAKPGRGPR